MDETPPDVRAQAWRGCAVWRHRRRGTVYTVIGRERGKVFYGCNQSGKLWWRPEDEFFDGRFEPLPDGHAMPPGHFAQRG